MIRVEQLLSEGSVRFSIAEHRCLAGKVLVRPRLVKGRFPISDLAALTNGWSLLLLPARMLATAAGLSGLG